MVNTGWVVFIWWVWVIGILLHGVYTERKEED